MAIFEDVTIGWKGEEFVVKSTDLLRLIAKIEDEISLQELTKEGGPSISRLSFGYAAALNHAGAKVSADEVYQSMFGGPEQAENVIAAVSGLIAMMMPPETYKPATTKKKSASKTTKKPRAK